MPNFEALRAAAAELDRLKGAPWTGRDPWPRAAGDDDEDRRRFMEAAGLMGRLAAPRLDLLDGGPVEARVAFVHTSDLSRRDSLSARLFFETAVVQPREEGRETMPSGAEVPVRGLVALLPHQTDRSDPGRPAAVGPWARIDDPDGPAVASVLDRLTPGLRAGRDALPKQAARWIAEGCAVYLNAAARDVAIVDRLGMLRNLWQLPDRDGETDEPEALADARVALSEGVSLAGTAHGNFQSCTLHHHLAEVRTGTRIVLRHVSSFPHCEADGFTVRCLPSGDGAVLAADVPLAPGASRTTPLPLAWIGRDGCARPMPYSLTDEHLALIDAFKDGTLGFPRGPQAGR